MSSNNKSPHLWFSLSSNKDEKERVLHNGNKFPMITFGVTKIEGYDNIYNAVDVALKTGYRSFECDPVNNQEEYLGKALEELLPKHGLQRKHILLTTKIFPKDYGVDSTIEAFNLSCEKLQTNYIDMYLMQWPGGHNMDYDNEKNITLRTDTWREMVKINLKGKIKNLGVCNFEIKHLEQLYGEFEKRPTLNQVEFHPKFPQLELLEYCNENDILLKAISFKETYHPLITDNKIVKEVAKSVNKTPLQVLLKPLNECRICQSFWRNFVLMELWNVAAGSSSSPDLIKVIQKVNRTAVLTSSWSINKGVAVVSQSEDPKIIIQNFNLFDFALRKHDMNTIDSITDREKYLKNPISVV